MDITKEQIDINLSKNSVNFEEQLKKTHPSFSRKIEHIKLTFLQRRLIVLIKLGFNSQQIKDFLNINQTSYEKIIIDTKRKLNLFNCFSLQAYIKLL